MVSWKKLKDNPILFGNFKKRAEILKKIRLFFEKENFLEVQTPLLAPFLIPESYLEVFQTQLKDKLGKTYKAFLTTSPEMWLKKLLVAGVGNCFEITKSFRNTDIGGSLHNPEFTILEWYRLGDGLEKTMTDCERLIKSLNNNERFLIYQDKKLDISQGFERLSVLQAFEKYLKVDENVFFDKDKLLSFAIKKGYRKDGNDSWEEIYNWLYVSFIEPKLGLGKPTFIYDFPAQFAALSKTKETDRRIKERFELYMFGIELADAYNELTDWQEQKKQFEKEIEERQKLGKLNYLADWDFIEALKNGLPDCSGVALGVDRLVMIFCNAKSLDEVILFSGQDLWPFN